MYYDYFIWFVSCTGVNFTCFVVFVCMCVCVRERTFVICTVLIFSVLRFYTYFYCFVVILLFCVVFIFVCISVGLLPPGESPTALCFVWPQVWWRQCCYNTAYGVCVCPSVAVTLGQTYTWFIYIYIHIYMCVCVSSTRIWNFTCCLHAGLSIFTFYLFYILCTHDIYATWLLYC